MTQNNCTNSAAAAQTSATQTTADSRLQTILGKLTLQNPVIPASGTFGFGYEFAELYDINCLGAISIKGTTREERYGNPLPRIAETSGGMINSVGLQNPGVEAVITEELPKLKKVYSQPVLANISGFSKEEFVYCCERMSQQEQIDIIELNISCPNVHNGGMSFGTSEKNAAEITEAVKKVSAKPVFVKLTPNVTDITAIAKACESAGADGLSLINTVAAMRIDLKKRAPLLANTSGGLSGGAIFPIALNMVYKVYKAVNIPIIGIGGIESAENVIEMMLAGASAIQIGAANLIDPFICKEIIEELPQTMDKYGIKTLKEIIGGAHQ